jgi:hypothetical protein
MLLTMTIEDDGSLTPVAEPASVGNETFPCAIAYLARSLTVDIDVKPGGEANSINPRGRGEIPVAVLGNESFDVYDVDPSTLTFGPSGAAPTHPGGHVDDVDLDGVADLVLHFPLRESGIVCGDTSVTLSGTTFDGRGFRGTDTIRTVGCRPAHVAVSEADAPRSSPR